MGPLSVGRNRSRWAGISGGGTVPGTITPLFTVAELTVIGAGCPRQSERTVRLTAFGAVTVFAGIHIPVTAGRADIAVVRGFIAGGASRTGVSCGDAVIDGITDFITVAEDSVVRTVGIVRCVYTGIPSLVAGVICTAHAVTAVPGRATACPGAVTSVRVCTIQPIITARSGQ